MKKILSLNNLQISIESKWELYQKIDGKMYRIDMIKILGMSFIDVIKMINEGKLFYSPDC